MLGAGDLLAGEAEEGAVVGFREEDWAGGPDCWWLVSVHGGKTISVCCAAMGGEEGAFAYLS